MYFVGFFWILLEFCCLKWNIFMLYGFLKSWSFFEAICNRVVIVLRLLSCCYRVGSTQSGSCWYRVQVDIVFLSCPGRYRVLIVSGQPKVVRVVIVFGSCPGRVRVWRWRVGFVFGFGVSLTGWVRVCPFWVGSFWVWPDNDPIRTICQP